MKKRSIAILSVFAMSFVLLTGCTAEEKVPEEPTTKETDSGDQEEEPEEAKEEPEEKTTLVVMSNENAESEILGQMIVQTMTKAGFEVDDQTGTCQSFEAGHRALTEGKADIYLDYTGDGLRMIADADVSNYSEITEAWNNVAAWDEANNQLTWLKPADFSNTYALAISNELSTSREIYAISDLARYINDGGNLVLAAGDTFVADPYGLPRMEEIYRFEVIAEQLCAVQGDGADALAAGDVGATACQTMTTSGKAASYGLVVLDDPDHAAIANAPSPVVRGDVLDKNPEIKNQLEEIFASISLDEMIGMNTKVQSGENTPENVAKDYLLLKGFLSE